MELVHKHDNKSSSSEESEEEEEEEEDEDEEGEQEQRERTIYANCVATCLRMVNELDGYEGLRLHVGIGAGSVLFMHVGGVLGRWEFVVAGEALVQMSNAEQEASAGDVCVSGKVWALIEKRFVGHPTVDSLVESTTGSTLPVYLVVGQKKKKLSAKASQRRWTRWDTITFHARPRAAGVLGITSCTIFQERCGIRSG